MAQGRNQDEEQIRSTDDQERVAFLGRDVPALERLWSEDFALNAPNNQVVVGRRAILDTFVGSGIVNFSRFDRQIELIRADGAYVFIMGLEIIQPISDAPEVGLMAGQTIERRFTNIWRNEGGTWRLFARHANVIPKR
jgi:ketosteroid isomerase-like protein